MQTDLKNLVVIGCSAGGTEALRMLFKDLRFPSRTAFAITLHVSPNHPGILSALLKSLSKNEVKEAESQEPLQAGKIYFAPPGYHLLVSKSERGLACLDLSVDDPVNYSRPSIDVLFESAAEALGPAVIGVVLTGANHDGAAGAKSILTHGGQVLIQDPAEADHSAMPAAALKFTGLQTAYNLAGLRQQLEQLGEV